MTPAEHANQLLTAVAAETRAAHAIALTLTTELGLADALAIIAAIQLAARHPGNKQTVLTLTSRFKEDLIEQIENAGLPNTAALARLGDNPNYDTRT